MQNDIRDAATVVYDAALIAMLRERWGDGWHEADDLFINGNHPNHEGVSQDEFEKLLAFDTVNGKACPVYLYMRGNEMVGWYDDECEYGYIA